MGGGGEEQRVVCILGLLSGLLEKAIYFAGMLAPQSNQKSSNFLSEVALRKDTLLHCGFQIA